MNCGRFICSKNVFEKFAIKYKIEIKQSVFSKPGYGSLCQPRSYRGYLKKFVNTLKNWWQEFLNYFDERITQGFVEGTNRAIRGIINRAFGYRCFEYFRHQVLIECGLRL
ncbi:MAG: transposase [bacterium]